MCKIRRPMDCSLSFLVDHRDLLANCQEIYSTGRARKKLLRSCSNPRSAACKSQHSDGEICIIILVAFGSLCLLRLLLISLSRQNEPSFFLKLRLSVGQDTCRDSTSLKFVFTKSVHLSPNLPAIPTSLSETASSHTRKVTDEKVCAPAFSAVWLPGAMRVETAHGDHGRFATIGGDGPQAAVRWCDGREDD